MSGEEYYTNFPPDFPDENNGGSSASKRNAVSGLFPGSLETPQHLLNKESARRLLGFNVFEDVDVEEQRNKSHLIIDYSSPGPANNVNLADTSTDDVVVNLDKDPKRDRDLIKGRGNKPIDIKTKKIDPYPDENSDYRKKQFNIVNPISEMNERPLESMR